MKYFKKKLPNELRAMLINLDTYFNSLVNIGNPMQVKAGFIHNEPSGIRAIDQSGGKQKTKLRQARCYVFPSPENQRLYLLKIGTKQTQSDDIRQSKDMVKAIKKEI
ncbi:MAG: hypothetical protein ACI9Y8_001334 [Candidatus Omnitrophota bacterium]